MYNGNPVYFTPDFLVGKGTAFSCGVTIGEIRSKCRKLATSPSGLDIVVIDYLTLIQGTSKNGANSTCSSGYGRNCCLFDS